MEMQEVDHNENETVSMLEEYDDGSGIMTTMTKSKAMVPKASPNNNNLAVEPLRKWRDAYVEMMLCFAAHVAQLNNGNVYLFRRIPKPINPKCLDDI